MDGSTWTVTGPSAMPGYSNITVTDIHGKTILLTAHQDEQIARGLELREVD
jgi:hypothetical protein